MIVAVSKESNSIAIKVKANHVNTVDAVTLKKIPPITAAKNNVTPPNINKAMVTILHMKNPTSVLTSRLKIPLNQSIILPLV